MPVSSADVTHLKLTFPVRSSLLFSVLALIADALYWYVTRSINDTFVFACATAAAVGGILAAVYAARTLNFQIQQAASADLNAVQAAKYQQMVFSMQYGGRWNEPHMEAARKACREIIELSGNGIEEIDKRLSSVEQRLKAVHLLNFLEEIATSIEYKVADETILKSPFGDAVILVWRSMGNWALNYRDQHKQPNAWKKLESLYMKWL